MIILGKNAAYLSPPGVFFLFVYEVKSVLSYSKRIKFLK